MSNTMYNQLKIGISGKRNIPDAEWVKNQIIATINKILSIEKTDSFIGYSAIASGADSIFASVVADFFNQPLNVILPFNEEVYGNDFKGTERDEYEQWIKRYPEPYVVTRINPTTDDERNEGYFAVGKYIVDHADYMIIVWDELKPKSKGGTSDVLGYSSIKLDWKKLIIIKVPAEKDDIDKQIKSLLTQYNRDAIIFKKKHEDTWRYSILLGFAAALCFAVYTSFHINECAEFMLGIIELASLITVYILIHNAKKGKYHDKLRENRLQAEKLRLLDIYHHADYQFDFLEIATKEDTELRKIIQKSNNSARQGYKSTGYKHYVISCLIAGQLDYHNNRIANRIGHRYFIYTTIASTVYVLFLVIIALHIGTVSYKLTGVGTFIHHLYNHQAGLFLSIIIPPVIAALHAWIHFNEWHELKEQSEKMIEYLEKQKELLKQAGGDEKQYLNVLNTVSAAMLADNKAWNIVVSRNVLPPEL